MIIFTLLIGVLNSTSVNAHPYRVGDTVLYRSHHVTHGRASIHTGGLKFGEIVALKRGAQVRVVPWDHPSRSYPGRVLGLDGRPTDGGEWLSTFELFREVSNFRTTDGVLIERGHLQKIQISPRRFEVRKAVAIFSNGQGVFFRNLEDQQDFLRMGHALFYARIAPTIIRPIQNYERF